MSKTAEKLAAMEIVCDRFHFKNHTDAWCKRNCNPNTCSANLQVNCLSCLKCVCFRFQFAFEKYYQKKFTSLSSEDIANPHVYGDTNWTSMH